MNLKKLLTKSFRGKQSGKKDRNEKPVTGEHEQKIIQQKMAMLMNGEHKK